MLKTQGLTPVTTEQGLAVAKKMGAGYMECGSKEMTGVEEIFEQALLTVVANDRRNLEAQAAGNGANAARTAGWAASCLRRRGRCAASFCSVAHHLQVDHVCQSGGREREEVGREDRRDAYGM